MTTIWHADERLLARYAEDDIDETNAYSVEAHLLSCEHCRERLGTFSDDSRLDRMWAEIAEVVDAPRRGVVERALLRGGVREHVARLVAATPSLRLSWFAAEAIALGFAVAAANAQAQRGNRTDLALLLFLTVAALLPVGGVAAAYGPGVDPTYEIGLSSPMRSFRLLMIRATAVLGTSTALACLAALALPNLDWRAAAWLLPSLGLTLSSLALSTWLRPLVATGAVALGWILVSLASAIGPRDPLIVFHERGQLAFAFIIAVSASVLTRRRHLFEQGVRT